MKDVSSYLRLALMFGENKANSFRKNLEKMIALVLFEKYSQGLTVTEIISDIKEKYSLEFSDSEIIGAIQHRHQSKIIQTNDETEEINKRYSITPKEYESIARKTDDSTILEMVEMFINTHESIMISSTEFTELLKRYLYNTFNSNADTVLALVTGENVEIKETSQEYSNEEKKILNEFIYWDNSEKNRCVYQLISCCFDYCMMTVHKDKSIYKTIIKQKKFYLDSNIVFRLMGLNNASRRFIIDAFVSKCREIGIKIYFSNHTRSEINDTISSYVYQIKNTLSNSAPISVQAMACLNDQLSHSDFYAEYVEWTKQPTNRTCDYQAFENDLKRKAADILANFHQVNFDDYSLKNSKEYNDQFESLKNYKINHRKDPHDISLKVDINNYLYVQERNREKRGEDFFSTDHFIITADHAFSMWEREKRPETIPTVVLPSVWYSIILQYVGRTTDDDYSSFTKFLNFSIYENENADPRKMEILKLVLNLQEPTEIKEKTVFDISEKLLHEYKDLDSEVIVETSHKYIIDQALEKDREKHQEEMQVLQQTHEQKISKISADKESLKKQHDAELEQVRLEEINRIIVQETDKRTTSRMKLYYFITGLLILGLVGVVYAVFTWISSLNSPTELDQIKYDYAKYIISGGYTIVVAVIIKFCFKCYDKEKISESIRKKVEKEYSRH